MEPMSYDVGSISHFNKGYVMKPSLMLAKKISQDELKEWSQRIWEEYFIEPKIDGERFVRTENGKWMSRQGKPKHNVEKICKAIDSVKKFKGYIIDGELFGGDWSDTISAAHTHHDTGIRLEYRIFDVVHPSKLDLPLSLRKEFMAELVECAHEANPMIVAVPSVSVSSYAEFMYEYRHFLASGCDGAILKVRNGPYETKRSKQWLKVKPYAEIDCKIVGFNEGKDRLKGTLGSIEVKVPLNRGGWSNLTTSVGTGFEDKDRDVIWKNRKKLMGALAEIRFRKISAKERLIEPRLVKIRTDLM